MKEPGLDGRHRDKSGEIQQKRGDVFLVYDFGMKLSLPE